MTQKTPSLIWAQRVEKVFITWEMLSTQDVSVTLSEGLLSVEGKTPNGDIYKLENLPLFLEIEPENSKWFKNDRSITSLSRRTVAWERHGSGTASTAWDRHAHPCPCSC